MEKERNNYYVYVHESIVTKEIFYVGKGTGDRGFRKSKRNNIWSKIAENGYSVRVVSDNLNNNTAMELEELLIKELGRIDNGTGILSNKTDGGRYNKGMIFNDEHRKKIADGNKGNTKRRGSFHSNETKQKISENRINIGIIVLDTSCGVYYNTIREAAETKQMPERTLHNWLTGKSKNKSNLILV